jgi:TolB-like protein
MIDVPFLGAESFPKPGNSDEVSLLGVYFGRTPELLSQDIKGKFKLGMNGPDELKLSLDASNQGVLWLKVEPGVYTIVPADGFSKAAGVLDSVEVPPSSVVLAPFRLVRTTEGARAERIDEGNRQFSGLELANHIDYTQWSERNLIGFGTLRPTLDPETLQFTVNITAVPEGAEVYVDDVLAGVTPLVFSLVGGKHRLLVRSAGFEDAIYYVRLEGDAEINAVLQPAAETRQSDKERYSTLVAPFVSMNGENDQLARLFADTLLLTLEADERLEVVPSTVPWVRRDALIHPDFLPLEEVGADLVVSGFFAEVEGRLNIQANLYDVQAETIRAAVTWFGTAGFDIFDAMDEIALEFADEVDRVLPAAGRTLITRQETVYSGADREENLLARKKLIRKRWEDNPNVLSLQGGFGGFMEEYLVNDGGSTNNVGKFEGPFFPIILTWDHDIGPSFAVGTGASFSISSYRSIQDSEDRKATWMASIFAGPRLVFRSLRADITIGIDFQVQYSPQVTYYWNDGVDRQADVGALLYIDLPMKVNFRYYFNKRIDTMPVFLSGGLGVSPLGYRFDLGGTGQDGMMSTYLFFNLGIGLRL